MYQRNTKSKKEEMMMPNNFSDKSLDLNAENRVNVVMEQNPSKKTDIKFSKLNFLCICIIVSMVASFVFFACKKDDDSDKKEIIPILKGTTWQSGGTVVYLATDSVTWTTYYANTSSTIFGTYKFDNPNIEMILKGLNGQVVEFDGTVLKDTMNLNFQGGLVFYKQSE